MLLCSFFMGKACGNKPKKKGGIHLHRPHHTNVAIRSTTKRPEQQRLPKRRRESEPQTRDARPQETDEQDRFASHALRIGNTTPHHRREEL